MRRRVGEARTKTPLDAATRIESFILTWGLERLDSICGAVRSGERLFLHKRSVHKALWVHSHEAKQGFTNQPKGSSSMLHAVPAHADYVVGYACPLLSFK